MSGMHRYLSLLIAILVLGMASGCAATKTQNSGFLSDYSQLKPDPKFDDMLRWQDSSANLASYDKFIIDPVLLHFAPNAKGIGIDPSDLAELTAFAHKTFVDKLSKDFKVVSSPGPDTLRLRLAITGIEKTTPLLNIHPAMKLSGAGLGGASGEGEALDSVTNKRIIAGVETRMGSRISLAAGLSSLGHAKQVVEYWADRLVKVMKQAHGMKT